MPDGSLFCPTCMLPVNERLRASDNGVTPEPPSEAEGTHSTDMGNAQRLVHRHGQNIRYCTPWGKWLCWDGYRWAVDDIAQVNRLAKETVKSIYAEAAEAATPGERERLAKWAVRSESQARIEAMIALARSEAGIPVRPAELDANGWLFNVENGTIDLHAGELRPHRREDLITKLAPVAYDPGASCPTFTSFLQRIMGGNADLIDYLRRTTGRALTADVSEHRLEIWHGVGANGKSTFMNALLDVMGDYGRTAAPGLLLGRHSDRHPTEVADLKGARFVGSVEVGENRKLAEELVKQLTGGDRLKARFTRQDFWEFEPTHKLFVACNHKPVIQGSDHAIWRRVKLVPFTVVIPEAEQDKKLGEKLKRERPGILNWLVEGCLQWQRDGLTDPEKVVAATADYRADMDVIAGFIEDCCTVEQGKKASATDLYRAYKQYSGENGEQPLRQRDFGVRLGERGFTSVRAHGGQRWWSGIGLVTQTTLDLDRGDAG